LRTADCRVRLKDLDVSDAERARIEPFLHNTDARIEDALERPGPPLEIWQLNAPGT
jgi:hypothetical protein